MHRVMSDRTCDKCGKEFTHPCRLKSHLRRKTPCDPIVTDSAISKDELKKPYSCRFCNRKFSTSQSLYQHTRSACAITVRPDGMDLLFEHTLKQTKDTTAVESAPVTQEVDSTELMRRLEDMERNLTTMLLYSSAAQYTQQDCGEHAEGTCNMTQNIVGTGVQISQHVHINVFGEEATAHIGRGKVKAMLDTILRRMTDPSQAALQALLETALMIYSDPERPENITCYLPARSGSEALVHVGGLGGDGWAVRPVHLVLTPMVQRCLDTIVHNQPFDDAKRYGDLMKALVANEQSYNEGGKLKAVLVRNKELRDAALGGKRTLLA